MGDIDLGSDFDAARLATASTRIADVARDHQYTVLADTNHASVAPYELAADPQTMAALANAGVRHIAIESLTGENPSFEAYASGEISDRTMEYGMTVMGPTNLVELYRGEKNPIDEKVYFDLLKNAKAQGIEVHAVNGSEGTDLPREDLDAILNHMGDMKLAGLRAIEAHPEFFDMTRRQQGDFMTQSLYDAGYNNSDVRLGLIYMGYRNEGLTEDLSSMSILSRLEQDPYVANRIEDFTHDEKTLVIYGQAHFLRPYGDIDSSMKDAAVIDLYADKAEYDRDIMPQVQELQQNMGVSFDDRGDYSLDLAKGIWTDNKTGEQTLVSMPGLESIPGGTAPPPRPALPAADMPFRNDLVP